MHNLEEVITNLNNPERMISEDNKITKLLENEVTWTIFKIGSELKPVLKSDYQSSHYTTSESSDSD